MGEDIGKVPAGYRLIDIPDGAPPFEGQNLVSFLAKETLFTNREWQEFIARLGRDLFILLHHNPRTGENRIVDRGHTLRGSKIPRETQWDHGDVIMLSGGLVALKMPDNPSVQYNEGSRIFSGEMQPVLGLTYFHQVAWCLFQDILNGQDSTWLFDLLTDPEFYYVASNRGTQDFGTEGGQLFGLDGRKLAHVDAWDGGKGTTVAVNAPQYAQQHPFGVNAVGNALRRTKFDPNLIPERQEPLAAEQGVILLDDRLEEAEAPTIHERAYGLRAGAWSFNQDGARASFRFSRHPAYRNDGFGFQPGAFRRSSVVRVR